MALRTTEEKTACCAPYPRVREPASLVLDRGVLCRMTSDRDVRRYLHLRVSSCNRKWGCGNARQERRHFALTCPTYRP